MLAVGEGEWDEREVSEVRKTSVVVGVRQVPAVPSRDIDATPSMAAPTEASTPLRDGAVGDVGADSDGADSSGATDSVGLETPSVNASRTREAVHPACGSTWGCFFWGYRDGGAPYPEERIDAMIQCESSWRIDPGGSHYGLAQFDPGTWATVSAITGLTDWLDPYQQGFNTATWASLIDPGNRAGWPTCWWAY